MKVKKLLLLFVVLTVLFLLPLTARAETDIEDELSIDLPGLANEALDGKVSFSKDSTLKEKTKEVYDVLSFGHIANMLLDSLKELFVPSFQSFMGIFALIVICSVICAVKASLGPSGLAAEYVGILCLTGYVFAIMKALCGNISTFCTNLCSFMLGMLPAMTTLYASGTGASTAAVGYTGLVFTLNSIQTVADVIIMPAVKAIFVLSVITAVSNAVNMSGISGLIKNTCIWGLSFCMTILCGVLVFQNIVASSADNLTSRTVRFAAVSFIPVIGNTVGESLKTVVESINVIKSITGALGIAGIITIFIPPFAALMINKFFILLSAALAKIMGAQKESNFLYEINGSINVLNAVAILISSVFIIIVGIFMKTSVQ